MSVQTETTESTNTNRTLSFLSGQLSPVEVAKIERELASLWNLSGSEHESGDGSGKPAYVIKSCALNFVLLAKASPANSEQSLDNLLAEITLRHPMRAILSMVEEEDDAAETRIEAWVSARCHFLPGRLDKQMCCEQITVSWQGQKFKPESLASVITPLVIPDLPSWLFLPGDTISMQSLSPFLPYFDHVLLDSRSATFNAEKLGQFRFIQDSAGKAVFIDLAWLILKPWRRALAFAFDEKDVSLSKECLSTLDTITIRCGPDGGLLQSLLLTSWLTRRLSFQFQKLTETETGYKVEFSGKFAPLTVQIEKGDGSARTGISSVDVSFHQLGCCKLEESLKVTFSQGALSVCYKDKCEFVELPYCPELLTGTTSECGMSELVDDALEHTQQDAYYLEAVSGLLEMFQGRG